MVKYTISKLRKKLFFEKNKIVSSMWKLTLGYNSHG
jgi:hypothetical protein